MIKILSVGNSFSQDAQRYLHDVCAAGGVEIRAVNLYIDGCSLERHGDNLKNGTDPYDYELNGVMQRQVQLTEAAQEGEWDIVTFQQASHFSGLWDTYQPWLGELSDYFHRVQPKARQYIHQTWAYEYDSDHGGFVSYNNDREEMHRRLADAYDRAAAAIGASVIPVGEVIHTLRSEAAFDPVRGGHRLSRDGFHLSLGYGRYAAAAVWTAVLFGADKLADFTPSDRSAGEEQLDPALLAMIRTAAAAAAEKYPQSKF